MALGALGGGGFADGGGRPRAREMEYRVEVRRAVGVGRWRPAGIARDYDGAARIYGRLIQTGTGEARILNPGGVAVLEGLRGQMSLPFEAGR